LAVLTDGKSRGFQQVLQEAEFSHNTLSPHLARLERQGMQEGQRQMRASKLAPNHKRRINTIFNHFSNTLARCSCCMECVRATVVGPSIWSQICLNGVSGVKGCVFLVSVAMEGVM